MSINGWPGDDFAINLETNMKPVRQYHNRAGWENCWSSPDFRARTGELRVPGSFDPQVGALFGFLCLALSVIAARKVCGGVLEVAIFQNALILLAIC